jgi:hypothetical protein
MQSEKNFESSTRSSTLTTEAEIAEKFYGDGKAREGLRPPVFNETKAKQLIEKATGMLLPTDAEGMEMPLKEPAKSNPLSMFVPDMFERKASHEKPLE